MKSVLSEALILLCVSCAFEFQSRTEDKTPDIYLKPNSIVFVGLPVVQDSIEKALADRGWTVNKFCTELRNELIFQLKKKKINATVDSNLTENSLIALVDSYSIEKESNYTQLKGYAILITAKGRGIFKTVKDPPEKGAIERKNNTLDNIRFIASNLAAQATKPPKKRKKEPVYAPQMWIIF